MGDSFSCCTREQVSCLLAIAAKSTAGSGVAGTRAATAARAGGVAPCRTPVEAGDCGTGLLGVDVARWPFPALRLPVGNEGEATAGSRVRGTWPGGLNNMSATIL
jgi:hypothetical protein